jgi:hypothetical protein
VAESTVENRISPQIEQKAVAGTIGLGQLNLELAAGSVDKTPPLTLAECARKTWKLGHIQKMNDKDARTVFSLPSQGCDQVRQPSKLDELHSFS